MGFWWRNLMTKNHLEDLGVVGRIILYRVCVPITGPVVAQRVSRGIALLFHDRGTRSV